MSDRVNGAGGSNGRRWVALVLGGLLLALTVALASGQAQAQSAASSEPYVAPPVEPTVFNGDLSKAPIAGSRSFPHPEGQVPGVPNDALTPGEESGGGAARTPGDAASTDASAPLVNFPGLVMTGGAPPDPTGEVGPSHFFEANNVRFQIFDRAGSSLAGPANINTIWAGAGGQCQTQNDGDPIVMYDQLADRWLIAQFAVGGPSFAMCIAISQTSDPVAGGFFRYEYAMPVFPDYEKFGIWGDGLYMSTFEGANLGVFSFDLAAMRAGTAGTFIRFTTPSSDQVRGSRLLPADIEGDTVNPAGAPNLFVQSIDADLTASPSDVDRLELFEFHRDPVPASSTFTKVADLATAPFDNSLCFGTATPPTFRDCIPQLGTANKVDPLANRLMWKADYRNFGDHESIILNQTTDTGPDIAGVRWYELRRTGAGPWSIFQQGTYAPDAAVHRWMGSAAINRLGEIGLGYSVSSAAINPGIRYTGRVAADPAGQLGSEQTLVNGTDSDTTGFNRWGDYSQMSVDPVDDCTMWYVGEYGNRRTRIGSFQVSDCVPDTTIGGGPTGPTKLKTPTFTLTSDEPGVTFQCALDGAAFAACPASFTTPSLGEGSHTLTARAIGAKGAVDPTPATRSFKVDTKVDGAKVKAKKKQKQKGAKIVVKLKAGAKEDVSVKATGKIKAGKSFKLKAVKKNVKKGKLAAFKLKPSKSAAKKIARANRAKAQVTVTFTDEAGNKAKKKKKIKLT